MDDALLRRYADLIVEVGANVQPGQIVWIVAEPGAAPLARLVAAAAYERVKNPSSKDFQVLVLLHAAQALSAQAVAMNRNDQENERPSQGDVSES